MKQQKVLRIDEINENEEYYPRNMWQWRTSYSYAKAMESGADFPPIIVAQFGKKYWLVDGKHRIEAYKMNKQPMVTVIIDSSITDFKTLYIEAVKRNVIHGRVISPYEKVKIMLKLEELQLDKAEISQLIRVPLKDLELFKSKRMTNTLTGQKVVLKAALKNMSTIQVSEDFDSTQDVFSAQSQIQLLDQLLCLLQNNYLDITNNLVKIKVEEIIRLFDNITFT